MKVVGPTLGDLGRAKAGLNQDVAALGTESSSDGLGQGVDTRQQSSAALNTELELLQQLLARPSRRICRCCIASLPCEQNASAVQGHLRGTWKQQRTEP